MIRLLCVFALVAALLPGAAFGQGAAPPAAQVWTNEALQAAISAHPKALVDFYADWCGPCKQMEPALTQLEKEGKVKVIRVDYDANRALAQQYGAYELPQMLAYKKGRQILRIEGMTPLETLRKVFD